MIYNNNYLYEANNENINYDGGTMDERIIFDSINNEPNIVESEEFPINSIYFYETVNVGGENKKSVIEQRDEEKFQKNLITNTKFTNVCQWEDINKYINIDNGFSEHIVNAINEYDLPEQYYESFNIFYINKKRKGNIETINTTLKTKFKGRIKNEDKNNGKYGKHNKYESDNIIKKCKNILICNVIKNINMLIDKEKKYESLLDLDYSFINNLKKDFELELLNKPLKDIVSYDISPKYKLKGKNWNKVIIEKIIQNEKSEEMMNLLNMSFSEWIDIFTYKIESEYNKEVNLLQQALDKINKKNDNDKVYLSKLIFYLYNYKRWFESKKGRNTNEKKDADEKKIVDHKKHVEENKDTKEKKEI